MPDFLKDYEPVEDRLRAFWSDHPGGRVMTTLIYNSEGHYIVYAEVWRSAGELPAASGLAHDSEDQLPPNMKTSALEVAETSAIGRSLANLGYAAKGRRPSREEMSKAVPAAGPAATQPAAGVATTEERPRTPPQAGAPTSVAAGIPQSPGLDPDGSSVIGEEAVRSRGVGSVKTTPGPTTCTHRYPSGRWLPTKVVDGQARCPRCGESAIKYREAS